MNTEALSASGLRIKYYLKDELQKEKLQSSIWLQELEKKLNVYQSDLMRIIYMTTESSNIEWSSLVDFKVGHGVVFCGLYFCVLLTMTCVAIGDAFFGTHISICGAASFAMTLISLYAVHTRLYAVPEFNFVLSAIFIAVVHFLNVIVFVESYCLSQQSESFCEHGYFDECFAESYQNALTSNTGYYVMFLLTFATTAIFNSLASFQAFGITCCVGYIFSWLYQATFFPACLQLYNSRMREVVNKFRAHFSISCKNRRNSPTEIHDRSSISEAEKRDGRLNDARHHGNSHELSKCEKLKVKFLRGYERYSHFIVSDFMRAINLLLYLTYLTFSFVGCLYFRERIAPKQLLSKDSKAYKYYSIAEQNFKHFGLDFTVYGIFVGNPWDKTVIEELLQIHENLIQLNSVNENLSTNWFQEFIEATASGRLNLQDKDGNTTSSFTDLTRAGQFMTGNILSWPIVKRRKDKFLNSIDWQAAWRTFIQTKTFQMYKANIVPRTTKRGGHQDHENEIPRFKFRWIYHTTGSYLPSRQKELISSFKEILSRVNKEILFLLVFDAPEVDWWTSINANRFLHSFVALTVLGILAVILSIVFIKSFLEVVWPAVISISVSLGIAATLSMFSIGCDPLSIPCVIFALPCTTFVMIKLLKSFLHHNGGRSESTAAALKRSSLRTIFYLIHLFFASMVLAYQPTYSHRAPLVGMVSLFVSLSLHYFLFVPTLLTVCPPEKKPEKLPNKHSTVKSESVVEMKPTTANLVSPIVAQAYFSDEGETPYNQHDVVEKPHDKSVFV